MAEDIQISDDSARQRYEARLGGALAGECHYELTGAVITFTHTKVQPEFEGKGVGSALARHVLDDARARHLAVVPACSFIAAYIERHAAYADLLHRG